MELRRLQKNGSILSYILAKKTKESSAQTVGRAQRTLSIQKILPGSGIESHHPQEVEHKMKRRSRSQADRYAHFGNEGANINSSFDDPMTELWTLEIELGGQIVTRFEISLIFLSLESAIHRSFLIMSAAFSAIA